MLTDREAIALEALRGVVRVADRKTDQFDLARAAIAALESAQFEPPTQTVGPRQTAAKLGEREEFDRLLGELIGLHVKKAVALARREIGPPGDRTNDPEVRAAYMALIASLAKRDEEFEAGLRIGGSIAGCYEPERSELIAGITEISPGVRRIDLTEAGKKALTADIESIPGPKEKS